MRRVDHASSSFIAITALALLLGSLVLCGALVDVLIPLLIAHLDHTTTVGALPALIATAPFLSMLTVSLALALRTLTVQLRSSRRLAGHIQQLTIAADDRLTRAATRAGLSGGVALIDASERFSFVYGLLRPRAVISVGLLKATSSTELHAILEHEHYHVHKLDPLRDLIARTVSAALFFLPVARTLSARYTAARELAADRRALAACGTAPLAAALLKVAGQPDPCPQFTVAASITGGGILDARVAQLEDGIEPQPAGHGIWCVLGSVVGLLTLAGTFALAVWALGGAQAAGWAIHALDASVICGVPYAAIVLALYALGAARAKAPGGRSRP